MKTFQSGGGRNTMPKPGVDLPDVTDGRSLMKKMRFYNILGHGSMYEKEHSVFLVPENTWVLFITRASVPAAKRKRGILKKVLDEFYYIDTGKENYIDWYTRVYNQMKDGTLFKDILYNNDKSEENFSIYEPGDLIQDLTVSFTNDHWPFMRLGIWKCPIGYNIKEYLDTINDIVQIAQHSPVLKEILEVKFPAFKKEYPAYSSGIDKIIDFVKNYSELTVEKAEAFDEDNDVNNTLQNKKIRDLYNQIFEIIDISVATGGGQRYQHEFFNKQENLIKYSPSVFEQKKNMPPFTSSLYELLTENRYIAPRNLVSAYHPTSQTLLLETPKYRFILVDACRSSIDIRESEALHSERLKLTRRLSVVTRFPVCALSLLQMTKSRFTEIIEGKPIPATSVIRKLLQGEKVPVPEFEEGLVGKSGNLRTVLERPFGSDTEVFFLENEKDRKGKTGTIQNASVNNEGKLVYKIRLANGTNATVPANSVFSSVSNLENKLQEIESNIVKEITATSQLQKEGQKILDETIQKIVREKELEEKKKQWDFLYSDAVKSRYPKIPKEYYDRASVYTYVQKGKYPPGTSVRLAKKYVDKDGSLGYIGSSGADEMFLGLLNFNDSDEKIRWSDIQMSKKPGTKEYILPVAKWFKKGDHVKIIGLPERFNWINGNIGEVIDIVKKKFGPTATEEEIGYEVVFYAQIPGNPEKEIITRLLKASNLEKVDRSTPLGIPPQTMVPHDVFNVKLTPEVKAQIQKNAEEKAKENLGMTGGKKLRTKKTRRLRKRRQTKRKASKH